METTTGHAIYAAAEGRRHPEVTGLREFIGTSDPGPALTKDALLDAFMMYQETVVRQTIRGKAAHLGITLT